MILRQIAFLDALILDVFEKKQCFHNVDMEGKTL